MNGFLPLAAPLALLASLGACTGQGAPASAPPPPADADDPSVPPEPHVGPPPGGDGTQVMDREGLERLLHNKGLTLQWIDWNTRGTAVARMEDGVLHLTGIQREANGPGELFLNGEVTEIGEGYFTFDGTIRITDTPDRGRQCEADKLWHFAITQDRPYYRLREFEWCDGLTDYVDIYF